MIIPIDRIRIESRFRKDLGDIIGLSNDIKKNGLLQPVTVDERSTLICGYRRIEACKLINIKDIPAYVLNLEHIRNGELSENTVRKDFTCSEMVEIKKYLAEKEREAALHRQREGRKLGGSIHSIGRKDSNKMLGGNSPHCISRNSILWSILWQKYHIENMIRKKGDKLYGRGSKRMQFCRHCGEMIWFNICGKDNTE